jgi:O-antigen/teichoic acid export membrane protein
MAESPVIGGELKKLLRHCSHYLAGIVGTLALGFVSFPIFTRVFSVADYGAIDLIQKILLLLVATSKMGIQNSALRFYDGRAFALDPEAGRRYYSTMYFGMVLTSGGVAILFLAGIGLAPASLVGRPLALVLCLVATLVLLRGMESMLWSFLRIEERTKAYNAMSVALKAAMIGAICILLPLTGRSPFTFFSGTAAVELVLVAALSLWLFRRGLLNPFRFDRPLFRAALVFGAPLIVYEAASIVLDAGDRVLVGHYLGADALGRYSVAYGLSSYVNNLLISPLNLALMPIYMRLWTSEGRERTREFLSTGLDVFLMVAVGVFAVATVASHDAVILLASSKYRGTGSLMPMIVAGLLIYTTQVFLSAGLLIQKKTGVMAKILLYSAVLNIAMNCVLLPRMGLQAAALATLVSYAFCILLLGRASFKILPLRLSLVALAKYGVAAAAAWGGASEIEMGGVFWNFACKSAVASLLYTGVLYALDARVRAFAAMLASGWRKRVQAERSEAVAASAER